MFWQARWTKKNSVEVKRLPIPILFNHHFCESMCSSFFCGKSVGKWLNDCKHKQIPFTFTLTFSLRISNYLSQKRSIVHFLSANSIQKWWYFSFDSGWMYVKHSWRGWIREVILVWESGLIERVQKLTFLKLALSSFPVGGRSVSKVFGGRTGGLHCYLWPLDFSFQPLAFPLCKFLPALAAL